MLSVRLHKRGNFLISAISLAAAFAFLVFVAPAVQAAESVTLSNGFEMRCDHHAQVDGRMRLYASSSADNYIEISPEEIVGFAKVADPPVRPADPAPASALNVHASPTAAETHADARLSPADLRQMLAQAGGAHNLDADLLASVVKAESDGNPHAVSRAGARGLMQLMPGTASELGVQDSFKPEQNVQGGSAYLDALLVRYHDNLALALAAYNAGPLAVDRYHGIPPYHETQAYVARVIHEFNRRVRAREAQARQTMASAAMVDKSGR